MTKKTKRQKRPRRRKRSRSKSSWRRNSQRRRLQRKRRQKLSLPLPTVAVAARDGSCAKNKSWTTRDILVCHQHLHYPSTDTNLRHSHHSGAWLGIFLGG